MNFSTPYITILQKPYCYAMACLLMIIYRRTGILYEQESLAEYFGVKIGEGSKKAFFRKLALITGLNHDEGIETLKIGKQLEAFFAKENIRLTYTIDRYEAIVDWEGYIISHMEQGHDIWCEYIRGDISDITKTSPLGIHDGLITEYDSTMRVITIINPEPKEKNRIVYPLDEFLKRMSGKYGRKTGCIIIS